MEKYSVNANKTPTRSYAAYNKNENIRLRSSSGGLFYTFAKSVIDEGGIVFGASFDENGQVFHKGCTTIEGIFDLMQSKYVQSSVKIEEFSFVGRPVRCTVLLLI